MDVARCSNLSMRHVMHAFANGTPVDVQMGTSAACTHFCSSKAHKKRWMAGYRCQLYALAATIEAPTALFYDFRENLTNSLPYLESKINTTDEMARPMFPVSSLPSNGLSRQDVQDLDSSEKLAMIFRQLGLQGFTLQKCLKYAFGASEEELKTLVSVFRKHRVTTSEFKTMLFKYPSLLKLTGVQVDQAFNYYGCLGFTNDFVRSLFVKRPSLLAYDLEKLSQTLDALICLGMQKDHIAAALLSRRYILDHDVNIIKRTVSALLRANMPESDIWKLFQKTSVMFNPSVQENFHTRLEFLLSVGLQGKVLSRALLRKPSLLSCDIARMEATLDYLQCWMEPKELLKCIQRFAELLSYDPESRLEPVIKYVITLGVEKKDIGKVILRRPQLMAYSVSSLQRTVAYLKSLGVSEAIFGRVLTLAPQVLTLNSEAKLKRGVEFFQSIGLDKEKDIEYIFSRSAQIFCCSIENCLQPKFEYFLSIGIPKDAVAKMIVLFPAMLGQNIENSLQPKLNYLVNVMNRPLEDLYDFPQYFGYSLEKRVKPRHEKMVELGIHKSLAAMLACTDQEFRKRYVTCEILSETNLQSDNMMLRLGKRRVSRKSGAVRSRSQVAPDHTKAVTTLVGEEVIACMEQANRCSQTHAVSIHEEILVPTTQQNHILLVHDRKRVSTMEGMLVTDLNQAFSATKEEEELYPSSFTKCYKHLSPCGIWIHAFRFDQVH